MSAEGGFSTMRSGSHAGNQMRVSIGKAGWHTIRKSGRQSALATRGGAGRQCQHMCRSTHACIVCGGAAACRATAAVPLSCTAVAATNGELAPARHMAKSSSPTSAWSFSICKWHAGAPRAAPGHRCEHAEIGLRGTCPRGRLRQRLPVTSTAAPAAPAAPADKGSIMHSCMSRQQAGAEWA